MNAYEVGNKIVINNKTYTIISVSVHSETECPNLFKNGYAQHIFMTLPKSQKIFGVNVLTNGKMTNVYSL